MIIVFIVIFIISFYALDEVRLILFIIKKLCSYKRSLEVGRHMRCIMFIMMENVCLILMLMSQMLTFIDGIGWFLLCLCSFIYIEKRKE